jgi:hypothetical protein
MARITGCNIFIYISSKVCKNYINIFMVITETVLVSCVMSVRLLWKLSSGDWDVFNFGFQTRYLISCIQLPTFGFYKILEIERGSTRLHPVENSLWKRLRTCRKTDCRMSDVTQWRLCSCELRWERQAFVAVWRSAVENWGWWQDGRYGGHIVIRRLMQEKVQNVLKTVE